MRRARRPRLRAAGWETARPATFCAPPPSVAALGSASRCLLSALRRLHDAQLAAGAHASRRCARERPSFALTRRWRRTAAQSWPRAPRRSVASTPDAFARISHEVRILCAWLRTRRLPDATFATRDRRAQRAMSSHDLTRVVALSLKAFELQSKRHFARAVEKFAAAIAAAQELSQVDCLVVAHLQLQHQAALVGYSATPGVAADAACAAKEQSCQVLLAAIATLERPVARARHCCRRCALSGPSFGKQRSQRSPFGFGDPEMLLAAQLCGARAAPGALQAMQRLPRRGVLLP